MSRTNTSSTVADSINPGPRTAPSPVQIQQLDHLNMTVRSLDESIDFYAGLFNFEVVERCNTDPYPWAIIKSGEAMLCLYEHAQLETGPKYPTPPAIHEMRHFALRITDGPAMEKLLRERDVPMMYGGPVTWPYSTAYYIVDPTGHQIELVAWNDNEIKFAPII